MAAFKDIVLRDRPDFLIRFCGNAGSPQEVHYLRTYERFLLTPKGPVRRRTIRSISVIGIGCCSGRRLYR